MLWLVHLECLGVRVLEAASAADARTSARGIWPNHGVEKIEEHPQLQEDYPDA